MNKKQQKLQLLLEELQGGLNDEFVDAIVDLVQILDSWAVEKKINETELKNNYDKFLVWLEEYEENTYRPKQIV